jgi:hypothetical protein
MFGWLLTKTNSNDLLATPLRFALLILTIYLRFTSSCDPKKLVYWFKRKTCTPIIYLSRDSIVKCESLSRSFVSGTDLAPMQLLTMDENPTKLVRNRDGNSTLFTYRIRANNFPTVSGVYSDSVYAGYNSWNGQIDQFFSVLLFGPDNVSFSSVIGLNRDQIC